MFPRADGTAPPLGTAARREVRSNMENPGGTLMKLVLASATALLALTACTGPGAASTPTPTPSSSPSVTPSASPSPSEVFDAHPDVADLVITTRGLLPLLHSIPIASNPGEAMLEWNETECYYPDLGMTENTGRWIATYPVVDTWDPFTVEADADGTVYRIDVWDPLISTPEGVHIGTTVADLQATYPDLVTGTAGWDAIHVYWITDADGYVVFETDVNLADGTVGPDQVRFIRILAPGMDPDWTVSQSDNIAGGCL